MNNPSFPPADDAIAYLSKVDWHKQLQRIIIVLAFIAAVVTVLSQRVAQWYNNGGKEQIVTTYNNLVLGSMMLYDWTVSEAIPTAQLNTNRLIDSLFYTFAEAI
jgi:hypothetical protein